MNEAELTLEVMNEVRSLMHRMTRAAQELHGGSEATAGKRGVLFSIADQGPQTVPQLARARPVSRQHIQVLVDALRRQKLVRTVRNPEHQRSPLIELTAAGVAAVKKMRTREAALLRRMRSLTTKNDLNATLRVLRAIREFLASDEWR
jgi:DNA-binding MarR family transcriptional regulator